MYNASKCQGMIKIHSNRTLNSYYIILIFQQENIQREKYFSAFYKMIKKSKQVKSKP